MDMQINGNEPTVMHIDLNSCFATVEQQADPLLRGKPIAVAAYTSPAGCVLAPSVEAKRLGVTTGMRVRDARLLCRDIVVLPPDPQIYRDVHLKLRNIFQEYSPHVVPKSIDEAVLDLAGTPALKKGLSTIGLEIKQRIRDEVGEWLSCNVGIATNRFLAKLAASLHKPDGLDVIDADNLLHVYANVTLTDLHGINTRYQARLNACGIYTPLDMLEASEYQLKRHVFRSIVGHHWYLRLRGWEVDRVDFERKSYGQEYSLGEKTADEEKLSQLIMKLCEKIGRRIRRNGKAAYGVHVSVLYTDGSYWHRGRKVPQPLYATPDIYLKALWLFNERPKRIPVAKLAISCYDLVDYDTGQLSLFEDMSNKKDLTADALDKINNKYGEYVITPARMVGMGGLIVDRISFGGVQELTELYAGKAEDYDQEVPELMEG